MPPLPAMTLRSSGVAPPTVFPADPAMNTPLRSLPRSIAPDLSVPIRFDSTRVAVDSSSSATPRRLSEITLPYPGELPPMTLFTAPPTVPEPTLTPKPSLPSLPVPAASVPM